MKINSQNMKAKDKKDKKDKILIIALKIMLLYFLVHFFIGIIIKITEL